MLFGNNLTHLPENVFEPLNSQLQLLLLNTNRLQCLHRHTFKGMKKLALLSLYDNQLRFIPNGTFDFDTLETLHLAKNPLFCDCKLAWLEDGLQKRQIETSGARCMAPAKLSRQRLGSIGTEKFECDGRSEAISTIGGCREADISGCPTGCKCSGRIVRCSKMALHYFPANIPSDTMELYLDGNAYS